MPILGLFERLRFGSPLLLSYASWKPCGENMSTNGLPYGSRDLKGPVYECNAAISVRKLKDLKDCLITYVLTEVHAISF